MVKIEGLRGGFGGDFGGLKSEWREEMDVISTGGMWGRGKNSAQMTQIVFIFNFQFSIEKAPAACKRLSECLRRSSPLFLRASPLFFIFLTAKMFLAPIARKLFISLQRHF
jgi:hypothetical protein